MSKSLRRAAVVAILAFGVFITLGSQQFASAQSGGGIAHDVFCYIDGEFQNTGVPLMPIFGTQCPDGEVPTQCSDGIDNDGDHLVDLNDPGCANGSDNDESNTVTPELGQCEDGVDNDTDGFTDAIDPNCHSDGDPTNADSYNPNGTEAGALSQCYDGIDNDDDGTTDWGVPGDENRDTDCSTPLDDSEAGEGGGNGGPTTGTITVQKVFGSGTTTPSSFSFTINGIMTTAFEADGENVLTLSPGTYTIAEVATSTYAASYAQCSEIVLSAGQAVTCVITNNAIVTPPPQSPACSDGLDNDKDGKTDMSDPGCSSAEDNDETDPVQPPPSGGGTPANGPIATGGGGGGNGPIFGSVFGTGGQVLGIATTTSAGCSALLNSYMRMGRRDNNVEDVKKLQQFLNDHMGANLPVTGNFGPMTDKAVRAFQAKYMSEVLTPWGIDAPTGFVYKTTMRWINMMHCSTLNIPIPSPLTPFKENA